MDISFLRAVRMECIELFLPYRCSSGVALSLLGGACLGILLPLFEGHAWMESVAVLEHSACLCLLCCSAITPFVFSRERPRSQIGNACRGSSTFLPKAVAVSGYGLCLTITMMTVGMIAANLRYGYGKFLIYPPAIGLGALGLAFLVTLLATSLGIIVVSLTKIKRRALTISVMMAFLLITIPRWTFWCLPEKWQTFMVTTQGSNTMLLVIVSAVILGVLDVLLLLAACRSFKDIRYGRALTVNSDNGE